MKSNLVKLFFPDIRNFLLGKNIQGRNVQVRKIPKSNVMAYLTGVFLEPF
jgi:hypothetical protein